MCGLDELQQWTVHEGNGTLTLDGGKGRWRQRLRCEERNIQLAWLRQRGNESKREELWSAEFRSLNHENPRSNPQLQCRTFGKFV